MGAGRAGSVSSVWLQELFARAVSALTLHCLAVCTNCGDSCSEPTEPVVQWETEAVTAVHGVGAARGVQAAALWGFLFHALQNVILI